MLLLVLLTLNADDEDVCLLFEVDVENGAKGSDPKGSLEKASFVADTVVSLILTFLAEKGSKESSKFSDIIVDDDVVFDVGAKGSLKGDECEDTGSVVVVGQADANGSVEFELDNPPVKLNGSCPPKLVVVDRLGLPKAVVTGAVKGSSLS